MKTIIVACGGGIATSATCATKINEALEERGLSGLAKAKAVDIKSLDNFIKTGNVIKNDTIILYNYGKRDDITYNVEYQCIEE